MVAEVAEVDSGAIEVVVEDVAETSNSVEAHWAMLSEPRRCSVFDFHACMYGVVLAKTETWRRSGRLVIVLRR